MTVAGLENNGYYINNPIVLEIYHPLLLRVEASILNQSNGKSAALPNLYADLPEYKVKFAIHNVVKGLFDLPAHNEDYTSSSPLIMPSNSNKFSINLRAYTIEGDTDEIGYQKTFIRGGNYNDESNQWVAANTVISPTPTVPIFPGNPYAFYTLNAQHKVYKINSSSIVLPNIQTEIIREKSCDGKYMAFLNSKGGYSYWMFDNWEEEHAAASLGVVSNGFNNRDLGQSYSGSFKVIGKIPKRFYALMRDLIFSPDIWLWEKDLQSWKKVYSDGNKWVSNGERIAYKVEYKFSDFNNYNPSLI